VPADGVRVTAFLFCDSVSRDTAQKTILVGVFDNIFVQALPAVHPSMAAFFRLEVPEPHHGRRLTIRITTPNGRSETSPELSLSIGPNGVAEGIVNFKDFPLAAVGTYEFALVLDDAELTAYAIRVERSKGPADVLQ
jgi:hypothetical protein